MKKLIAIALAAAALAAAVSADATAPNRVGIHWGQSRALGAGSAAAWVAVDVDGSPASMGVSIDEAALAAASGSRELEAVLPLPQDVTLAGAASGKAAFRVRYDQERRAYLVMLDGLAPVAASPGALSARAGQR